MVPSISSTSIGGEAHIIWNIYNFQPKKESSQDLPQVLLLLWLPGHHSLTPPRTYTETSPRLANQLQGYFPPQGDSTSTQTDVTRTLSPRPLGYFSNHLSQYLRLGPTHSTRISYHLAAPAPRGPLLQHIGYQYAYGSLPYSIGYNLHELHFHPPLLG